jgi:hypothetical protein
MKSEPAVGGLSAGCSKWGLEILDVFEGFDWGWRFRGRKEAGSDAVAVGAGREGGGDEGKMRYYRVALVSWA